MMKRLISCMTLSFSVLLPIAGVALAANPHGASNPTGQPSQTCLSSTAPLEPGNAASASGSAFNENGGIAGGVYAGNGISATTANSGKAVSQYDVACFQNSQMP